MICKYNVHIRLFLWTPKHTDLRKVCELLFVLFFADHACLRILSKIFNANNDRWTEVKQQIEPPITAVALRFHPTAWSGDMCMRVEAFGCDGEYIATCCLPIVMYSSTHIQGGF